VRAPSVGIRRELSGSFMRFVAVVVRDVVIVVVIRVIIRVVVVVPPTVLSVVVTVRGSRFPVIAVTASASGRVVGLRRRILAILVEGSIVGKAVNE
jgi:hypothetical protein